MSQLPRDGFDPNTAELVIPEVDHFEDGDEIIDFLRTGDTPLVTEFIDRNRGQFESFFDQALQNPIDIELLIDGLDSDIPDITNQCREIINQALDKFSPYIQKAFFELGDTAPQALQNIVENPLQPAPAKVSLASPLQRDRRTPLNLNKWGQKYGLQTLIAATAFAGYVNYNPAPEIPKGPSLIDIGKVTASAVVTSHDLVNDAAPYVIEPSIKAATQMTGEFYEAAQALETALISVRDNYPTSYYSPFLIKNLTDHPENIEYLNYITEAALEHGLNPVEFANQIFRESAGFDPIYITGAEYSSAGAVGIAQIMPATGAERGLSLDDLINPRIAIFEAAEIMAENMDKYGHQNLAAAAYNGGGGSIRFPAEELMVDTISYDQWLEFNTNRRAELGVESDSAWHVQTYDYVQFIDGTGWEPAHQEWAQQQQNGGLPLNMASVALMIADHHGTLDSSNNLVNLMVQSPEILSLS